MAQQPRRQPSSMTFSYHTEDIRSLACKLSKKKCFKPFKGNDKMAVTEWLQIFLS
jgi:hypothetical protein